jgi:tRNA(His) 5'-end guanylyltransferase
MSSINQITAVIVESLLNSPYKGYYKKDYLSVLKTLNSIYQEKQKFEDWMVDDFVNQIVGGTKDLLKRYPKLGKSKECARNMLEHYIYWTYEIGNDEEAENIKKAYEETTGLKYNKNLYTENSSK